MEQLAVRNIDEPDQARHHVEVPEKIGVDLYVPEKLGQKITPEGDPIVSAGRGEIGHIVMCLYDLRVGNSIPFDEKSR